MHVWSREHASDDCAHKRPLRSATPHPVGEKQRPDCDPGLDGARYVEVVRKVRERELAVDRDAGGKAQQVAIGRDARGPERESRRAGQRAKAHHAAHGGFVASCGQQRKRGEERQLRLEHHRAKGDTSPQRPVRAQQPVGGRHSQGHENSRLAQLQRVDDRKPPDRGGEVDDPRGTRARRGPVPRKRQGAQEQDAPGPVSDRVRKRRQRHRRPGHWRRADVTSELGDLDSRSERVELRLLKVEVVDVWPAMRESDSRRREVKGEVVVEAVGDVGGGPLVEVVGRERHGGSRSGGRAEIAPAGG